MTSGFHIRSLPRVLTLAFVVAWSLGPIYIGVVTSLSTRSNVSTVPPQWVPHPVSFEGYAGLLPGGEGTGTSEQFVYAFLNSVILAGVSTTVALCLAVVSGYAFSRLRFPGRRIVMTAVVGTLVVPLFLLIVPLFRLLSTYQLIGTFPGLILLYVTAFTPLGTWLFYNYVRELPVELEQAARVDGCTRFQAFVRIVLPQMRSGIAALAAILLLATWGEFTIPLIFATNDDTQPLTVIITQFVGKHSRDIPLMMAAGVISMLLPAAIALGLSKHIREMVGGWGGQ